MRLAIYLVGFVVANVAAWAQETTAPQQGAPPAAPSPSASALQETAPEQPRNDASPSPTPTPSPAPSPAPEEAARQSHDAAVNALLTAVFHNDSDGVRESLAAGTNPNDVMPVPIDPALAELFRPTVLNYFLTGERGLTPLMVAAALGNLEAVQILLQAGADPEARAKRYGTNALWLAGYKGHVAVAKLLLGVAPGSETDRMRIEIDLASQTARLFVGDVAEKAVPVSTGRKGYATPTGEFVVTDKHEQWRSTIYGASMPFYLRLSCRAFGLHAGQLPGYPASHGCIRMNHEDARDYFNRVPVGTLVVIK